MFPLDASPTDETEKKAKKERIAVSIPSQKPIGHHHTDVIDLRRSYKAYVRR